MVCGNDKCLGLFLIDAKPVAEDVNNAYANLEKVDSKPKIAEVENPKYEMEITKEIDEPEESPKSNSNNDSFSNSNSKNNKDIMEFTEEKIKNKVTQESVHNANEVETDPCESLKERDEQQPAPHQ